MKYKIESGRSMVEMLGTLAIMGVLSIGGIMAYSYAMDKYRASETINELTVRAMGLMNQVNRAEIVELNMEMGNTTKFGYFVDAWIGEVNTDYFYISLEQVPPSVCRHMLKIHWETPTAVYVGDSIYYGNNEYICGKDTYAPPIDFEFYRDFAIGTEYAKETYYETTSYSDVVSTNPTQTTCTDSATPLGDIWGSCYACDTTEKVYVSTRGKCEAVCQNRQLSTGGYCALACGDGDFAELPVMKSDGTCVECVKNSDCGTGELCLSKNNSGYSSDYEVCKPYEVVQYDGFARVKVNDTVAVSWWDAKKVCEDNGYSLVSGYELFDGWKKCVGNITSCGGAKTDLFNNLRKITNAWIWVKEPRDGNAWHIYLENGTSSHYNKHNTAYTNAFCKTR